MAFDPRRVPIPNLPGNHIYRAGEYRKTRPQTFTYVNGIPLVLDQGVAGSALPLSAFPGSPRKPADGAGDAAANANAASSIGLEEATANWKIGTQAATIQPALPAWVAFDRMVLRFYAYFKESVPECEEENFRIRACVLLYYLEDGSLSVVEPKQDNSGLDQGTFLKRHRIPKADGSEVVLADLRIGGQLELYSRVFVILACDPFTRKFMTREGIELAPDQAMPEDPHARLVKQKEAAQQALHQHKTAGRLTGDDPYKFFTNDRKVLRFNCYWDDSGSLYGDVRLYELHYYLADDTVEVVEVLGGNSGRDPFPRFLHRMRLPKTTPVIGARPLSAASRARQDQDVYTWQELRIGSPVQELRIGSPVRVYNRTMWLYDCDDFTRRWYRDKLGLGDAALAPRPLQALQKQARPPIQVPPNTSGIGSELDSLQNVYHLVPKAVQPDFNHFVQNDGKVLRFTGRMVDAPGGPVNDTDAERRFVVSYYLSDDSIQIFEPPLRNSGIAGGKFLERRKLVKPGSREEYNQHDMFMGARIAASGRTFELTDADDYTLKYMEAYRRLFPKSDYHLIISKLHAGIGAASAGERLRTAMLALDPEGSGSVPCADLQRTLAELGVGMTLHEVATVARQLSSGASHHQVSILGFLSAVDVQ
ncbi:hypothetical protein WJX72_000760 [[Myrmecia] bisecta]|uniref:DM10 domain-containing protein n=1 Tax=[Myrmecia] bisecta TaxID=41462 RepID=A0AAW1R566_9CHLO